MPRDDRLPEGSETGTRGFVLTREAILSGRIERFVRENARRYNLRIKSVEERTAIMREMLTEAPAGEDVWVFGYGSLMWNPAFRHTETRAGRVHGYHRRFVFWSTIGRGSREKPGMMMGLSRGGSCNGLALRIAAGEVETELRSVFMREMVSTAYDARWVTVRTADGAVSAITFVANPDHVFYAGRVPPEEAARHIAFGEGELGSSREYLYNTVSHLDSLGIRDTGMQTLSALVKRERARAAANE